MYLKTKFTFFANQCRVIDNISNLSDIIIKTNHKLNKINVCESEIQFIVRAINVNKAQ